MIGIILALAMFNFHTIIAKLVNFKTSLSKSIESSKMSNAPCPKATKLKIILKGNVSTFDTNCDQDVEGMITVALTHFGVANASTVAKDYKLIVVQTCKVLLNDAKIADIEDLKTNDELLLVPRVNHSEEENRTRTEILDKMESPSAQEILAMTADIEPKNTVRQFPLGCSSNFLTEIRKIFITLTEVSALILSVTTEADAVAADLRHRLEAPLDSGAVTRLTALGYTPQDTAAALRLHHMDAAAALEWLLASHPLPADEAATTSTGTPATPMTPPPTPMTPTHTPIPPPPTPHSTEEGDEKLVALVARLVDEFRAAKRRNFVPNPRAVQNLTEMGFGNTVAVHQALLVTGNNQTSACEWMLGERRPSLLDLDTGLDETGPVYASVMANPAIQMGLRSPRVLLALLSMIQNPDCINKWLRDPEASPVISQVFKTYHAEKHSV